MTRPAPLNIVKKSVDLRNAEVILYSTENNRTTVDAIFHGETLWLTQKKMTSLFDVKKEIVTENLKKTFTNNNLEKNPDFSILELTTPDGKAFKTRYYNLDAVIAVGFLVNSRQAIQFCTWVNQCLRDFLVKGMAMDDERLKEGKQYFAEFDQLLEVVELANIETKKP